MSKLNIKQSILSLMSEPKTYLWFYPQSGRFLFFDRFVEHEIVLDLIESKAIQYSGIHTHQGQQMIRYKLTQP